MRTSRGVNGVVRSLMLAVCLCAIFAGGCVASNTGEPARSPGDEASTDQASQSSDPENVAATASIVCGPDGTSVAMPRVRAHPDGVHFVVDNRFKKGADYSFEYQEGGGGGESVPHGESAHVGDFPPGRVRIGCEKPPVDGIDVDYVVLEVVDPEGVYKPVELECEGEMVVSGGPAYASGIKGKTGDLVEISRRSFSDQIRGGDQVELAGYPQSSEHRTVRVVRDGRVIAKIVYFREGKGWLQDQYEACANF